MIFNKLAEARRYEILHPGFRKAFDFLSRPDLKQLAVGTYELDGKHLFARVEKFQGLGHQAARFEIHRRYLDIQYTVSGNEHIGIRHASICTPDAIGYDITHDVMFCIDPVDYFLLVPDGHFAIFYPGEDAHAPNAGTGLLHKVVVKVEIQT